MRKVFVVLSAIAFVALFVSCETTRLSSESVPPELVGKYEGEATGQIAIGQSAPLKWKAEVTESGEFLFRIQNRDAKGSINAKGEFSVSQSQFRYSGTIDKDSGIVEGIIKGSMLGTRSFSFGAIDGKKVK
ncbi:MAG: hypothetical protein IJR50_04630 [Treponema sp.]|nr:hypothetical protein [Treponema sp.]